MITCLDLKGATLFEDRFRTDNSVTPERFLRYIWDLIEDNLRDIRNDNIVGLGVGIRGIVDNDRGGISLESFGLWDEQVNVKAILTNITHLPVSVDNNVRNIARGQLFFFARQAQFFSAGQIRAGNRRGGISCARGGVVYRA